MYQLDFRTTGIIETFTGRIVSCTVHPNRDGRGRRIQRCPGDISFLLHTPHDQKVGAAEFNSGLHDDVLDVSSPVLSGMRKVHPPHSRPPNIKSGKRKRKKIGLARGGERIKGKNGRDHYDDNLDRRGLRFIIHFTSFPACFANTFSFLYCDYRPSGSGIGDSYLYPTLYRGTRQGTIRGVDGNERTFSNELESWLGVSLSPPALLSWILAVS